MADTVKNIILKIKSDTASASRDMKAIADNSKKASNEVGKIEQKTSRLNDTIKRGAVAFASMYSISRLVNFAKESAKLYDQQVKAETALLTALKGRQDIQQRLLQQATELQRKTIFGDEEIIRAQTLAASMGLMEDKIKKLIPAALDLSTATGMTLEGAVRNLARTFGGLTGELGEAIPALRNLSQEELKAGKAIEIVNKLMGGQAEAAAKVGTGALQQLSNAWGDLRENIGELIITTDLYTVTVDKLYEVIDKIQKKAAENKKNSPEAIQAEAVELVEKRIAKLEEQGLSYQQAVRRASDEFLSAQRNAQDGLDKLQRGRVDKKTYDDYKRLLDVMTQSYEYIIAVGQGQGQLLKKLTGGQGVTTSTGTNEGVNVPDVPKIELSPVRDEMDWREFDKETQAWYNNLLDELLNYDLELIENEKDTWSDWFDWLEQKRREDADNAKENAERQRQTDYDVLMTKLRIASMVAEGMGQIITKNAKAQRALNAFAATIDTIAAMVATYKEQVGKVGPELAFLEAAAVGVWGFAQVAAIASQPLPSYAKGGYTGKAQGPYRDQYGPIAGVVHEDEYVFDHAKTALLKPLFDDIHHDRIDVRSLAALTRRGSFRPIVNTMSTDKVEKLLQSIYEKLPGVRDEVIDMGDHIQYRRKGNLWKVKKK